MKLYSFYYVLNLLCIFIVVSQALPTSLLENTKSLNVHNNKVKRTPGGSLLDGKQLRNAHLEESNIDSTYFNKPSAKKRGGMSTQNFGDLELPTWEPESQSSDLYSNLDGPTSQLDEKTLSDYEKGFQYGTNKEKLDEQMENAILKSELYGEPTSLNQYRYYGQQDARRKRNSIPLANLKQLNNRFKREIIGNPEDDLFDLISLWEAQRKYNSHKPNWQQKASYNPQDFGENEDEFVDDGSSDIEESDENWLETPVYPNSHQIGHYTYPPQRIFNTYYDTKDFTNQPATPNYIKRQWNYGYGGNDRAKRFMVSRKRSDPTRELRYFTNGGAHNRDDNIYTLAQLLSGSQREPNVPLYHRAVL